MRVREKDEENKEYSTQRMEIGWSFMMREFSNFSTVSGLQANLDKSCIYFCGLSVQDQEAIQELLPIPKGQLPFRYLGVPLSSRKLSFHNCKPLLEKVQPRVSNWSHKLLSYAGRLQLIRAVIFGIQAYWCQIFLLPKKVLREIEKIFRLFLWTGKDTPSRKASVAWDQMCFPRAQGGWNLISLPHWNRAASIKLLCLGHCYEVGYTVGEMGAQLLHQKSSYKSGSSSFFSFLDGQEDFCS